jgi:hypothetical protein
MHPVPYFSMVTTFDHLPCGEDSFLPNHVDRKYVTSAIEKFSSRASATCTAGRCMLAWKPPHVSPVQQKLK